MVCKSKIYWGTFLLKSDEGILKSYNSFKYNGISPVILWHEALIKLELNLLNIVNILKR